MLETLNRFILSNNTTDFTFIDSDIVRFFGDNIGILSVDLNNISLDDFVFDKKIRKQLFVSHIWLGLIHLNNIKHLKKI